MPGIWEREWLNANSQRRFPLSEDATAEDLSESFRLPNDFLVGLTLPVHAGHAVDPNRFFLRSVTVSPIGYNIAIGYDDGSAAPPIVASTVIAKSTHQENRTYILIGSDDFADTYGQVAIGLLDSIDREPAGQFLFSPAGGKLDPHVIRPQIRGISSIRIQNGAEISAAYTGDLVLTAGRNISLQVTQLGDEDPEIRIDAIDGAGLNEECECTEDDDEAPPIRRINGIPATAGGDFTLVGSACLEISPIANGLQLVNPCAEPCCGCPELEAITRDLDRFGDAATTLRNFVNNLSAEVTQMSAVVLGSRLSDSGCLTCE